MEHTEQTKNIYQETKAYRFGQKAYKCIHTESIVKWLASLVKWLLIVIAAAIAFYCVYPKYYYCFDSNFLARLGLYTGDRNVLALRGNRITGKVEICRNGRWLPLTLTNNMQSNWWEKYDVFEKVAKTLTQP